MHMMATLSATGLNDAAKVDMHKRWYFGLLQSVFASPESQQLRMNPMVDVIAARPVNGGDPVDFFFNPEWHFVRLQHSLSAPKS